MPCKALVSHDGLYGEPASYLRTPVLHTCHITWNDVRLMHLHQSHLLVRVGCTGVREYDAGFPVEAGSGPQV